jgi:hypothetical protein
LHARTPDYDGKSTAVGWVHVVGALSNPSAAHPAFRIPSCGSARRLLKNAATSRDSVSAIAVSSLEAESTDSVAELVLPKASESEPMLTTRVSLPCAASCAFWEISRAA